MKNVKAYIARDKNGELYFYAEKPELREDGTFIASGFMHDKETFKEIEKCKFKSCIISFEE